MCSANDSCTSNPERIEQTGLKGSLIIKKTRSGMQKLPIICPFPDWTTGKTPMNNAEITA
jgi:hypothetical protein